MSLQIDYYFSLISPFSYMGHKPFTELARGFDATINYKPVRIGKLFEATGGLPPAKRHPARQAYRMDELKRWSTRLGAPLNLQPKHFPTNDAVANMAVVEVSKSDQDAAAALALAFHQAVWVNDLDISDEGTVSKIIDGLGLDAGLVAAAKAAEAQLDANTEEAVSRNVFGAPTYIVGDEMFWGQDRIDFLKEALARASSNALAMQLSS